VATFIRRARIICNSTGLFWNRAYIAVARLLLSVHDNWHGKAAGRNTTRHRKKGPEVLSLKTISSRRFNRFLPAGNHLGTAIGEEVEWFVDDPENAIGTIAFDTDARGWNYAILRRDWKGDFQVCDLRAGFHNFAVTRADFLLTMTNGKTANATSFQPHPGDTVRAGEQHADMLRRSE